MSQTRTCDNCGKTTREANRTELEEWFTIKLPMLGEANDCCSIECARAVLDRIGADLIKFEKELAAEIETADA